MEQTIGKRIMQYRKQLGMTQDQLAEKLGVTAQAVSKWENDQSCPDISILVTLADIFSITTDTLLGRTNHQTVYQAELVDEDDLEDENISRPDAGWTFQYESSRHWALCFAIFVLTLGIQILIGRLQEWELSTWSTIWTTALTVYGLFNLIRSFSFFSLGCFLFGVYFMLDNLQLTPFALSSALIFPLTLLLFGVSLLVDALKKPKKASYRFHSNGKANKTKNEYHVDGEHLEYTASFGEHSQDICMDRLSSGRITTSFGDYEVDMTDVKEIGDNCQLQAICSFGELTVLIPRRFATKQTNSTSFGEISVSGQPDPQPQGVIHMKCTASFGEICIKYI